VEEFFGTAHSRSGVTSVKEFVIEREPTETARGRGRFAFTDDYSVFDWGKMPDEIPGKGASLCLMGAANFELLEANGIPTHYRGVVASGGGTDAAVVDLDEISEPPRQMAIELVRVPQLPFLGEDSPIGTENGYDYDSFHTDAGSNYLIPLEIVFRNEVPVGSSLRSRRSPADVGLDHDEWPEESVSLPDPVVEFSTKFEEQDRYLTRAEADRIAGPADIDRLAELARAVNHLVTERAADAGLTHEDGKIECYYDDGEIGVADVLGTFDENRFAFDGQEVSKEVVRQFYKREHPDWVEAVGDAKEQAEAEGVAEWRQLCETEPPELPAEVVGAVADLYAAGANAYVGGDAAAGEWFDAPALAEAVDAVREL
jgi:phosphoribosylaminoimidazole-succinocarboxamide synthase